MRLSYVPDETRSPEELAQMVTMEDANEGEQE